MKTKEPRCIVDKNFLPEGLCSGIVCLSDI
jgi:hypothetical protein